MTHLPARPIDPAFQQGTSGSLPIRRVALLVAAILFAGALRPASAHAEETPQGDDDTLSEIVVTAQKRSESVQKVPISISVLQGETLDRSTSEGVADVLNTVPGVATIESYQGGGTLVTVRGVTAGEALLNGAGTVAYYLDSMPFGLVKQAIGPDASAYDMQRIEVLRGPQGTLYGANALNGVVRVLTNDADLHDFYMKARVSGSTTENGGAGFRGDAAVNVPLVSDKLAARAVVGYQDLAGWIDTAAKKDFNDAQLLNLRLKVNAQPTDALSLALSLWRSKDSYGGPSIGELPRFNSTVFPEPIDNDYDTAGLKATYQFSGFSVSSMTSYLDYSSESNLDFTPFVGVNWSLATDLGSRVFAEEILTSSTGEGPWRWSLGYMYRRATETLVQLIPQSGTGFGLHYYDESKSNAVYGELTRLLFGGKIELTAGLRYFHDDISQANQTGLLVPGTNALDAPIIPDGSTAKATTPRAVITWHPDDRWTIYGSYSEGFRSGFPQNAPAAVLPPTKPDLLKNYELGSKASLMNGRLKFDLALYYMDWQRVQQNITVSVGGLPFAGTVNGNSASGVGVDFAVAVQPIPKLSLGATFSWNNLEMDEDVFSGGVLLFPKGERLNLSAEYTAGVSADYRFPLSANGLEGTFSVAGNYISEMTNSVLLPPISVGHGDASFISRASFSVASKGNWTGTLYGDNLNNYQKSPIPGFGDLSMYYGRVRPRTVGLQIEYRY